MIGCEKLCGTCDACGPLDLALQWVSAAETNGWDINNAKNDLIAGEAARAILDPAALADLLARALRGRGAEGVEVLAGDDGLFGSYHADGLERVWDAVSLRWRLTKLLAADLCSADEALRLLEGT